MGPIMRHPLAAIGVAASLAFSVACEQPSLNVETWDSKRVEEVRVASEKVSGAYEEFPEGLRATLGSYDVFVTSGPITELRRYHYLSGEPAPGYAETWDEVAMAYDREQGWTLVSVENTESYFRGYSTLEEEAWHALDDRHGFSESEVFRELAKPHTGFFSEENYGSVSEDRMYAEIFAEEADRSTDEDGDILRVSHPALMAWYDELFGVLEQRVAMCKSLKPVDRPPVHVRQGR